ncbi:MAG: hypothetical protein ABIS51_11540 [Sphingomonas sp.]
MVQTTTDPGTISVPMSSILDALEGVLTEAERTALFEQLIGLRPAGVSPGDLITAELFNQVLSDVNDLAQRVAVLEGGSDHIPHLPVITQIVPQIVKTGQEFTVFGENLNASLLSRIDIDDTNIPLDRIKDGSSPTRLVLNAPAIIGLPDAGATVIIAVSNPAGTAQGSYMQLPGVAAQIQANISFTLTSVTPNEAIKPNKAYDYSFELDIHSSHDETFVLSPQISGQGWSAVVKGAAGIDATSASSINGLKVTKVITVTSGPSGSGSLVLNIHGTNFPNYSASSQPTVVAIAAAQNIPTDKVKVNTVIPIGPNAKFTDNTLWIKRQPNGSPGTITLTVQYLFEIAAALVGGAFQAGSPAASPASDWTATRVGAGSFQPGGAGSTGNLSITIKPINNGTQYIAGPGQLDFTMTSTDGTVTLPFTAQLRIVDALPVA